MLAEPAVQPAELRERNQVTVGDLPPALDLVQAARLLGVGRTCAYELVRTGQWPTPVLRLGRLIRIPTAPLLELLGVSREGAPA